MKFIAHPWQDQIIGHQLDIKRGASWAGMGTGKTVSTLTALQTWQDLVDPRPYLVLAPKRVASRTWPREIAKWDHLDGEVRAMIGTPGERAMILRGGLRASSVRGLAINYENIPWLIDFMTDAKMPWPFATIVSDESTKLKSYRRSQGGKRAQALAQVAWGSEVDRFIELTGTPSPNGLKDLWGQMWFEDKGVRLGRSYTAFMERWFVKDYTGFGWDPMAHADEEIHERLRDICLSVNVPVDAPTDNKIMIELPSKARDLYRRMEKDAFVEIGSVGIESVHAAAKTNKLLQIAAGHMYDEDKIAHHIHDAKIEALESIVAEAGGMPVLVAINFKFEAPAILKAFPQARVIDTDQDIDDFAAGKIGVGVAHPGSLGHGINDMERATNICAIMSGDWNLEFYLQIIERIGPMRQQQSGMNRGTVLHHLIAEGTMDEEVYDRRIEKISVQEALRRATERRGLL